MIVDYRPSCPLRTILGSRRRFRVRTRGRRITITKTKQPTLIRARNTSMRVRSHPLAVAAVMAAAFGCAVALLMLRIEDRIGEGTFAVALLVVVAAAGMVSVVLARSAARSFVSILRRAEAALGERMRRGFRGCAPAPASGAPGEQEALCGPRRRRCVSRGAPEPREMPRSAARTARASLFRIPSRPPARKAAGSASFTG